MSIKQTVDHVRSVVATVHAPLPMAKGRDLIAEALFGRPYSACLAAERAGKAVPMHSTGQIAQAVARLGIVRSKAFLAGVIQALNSNAPMPFPNPSIDQRPKIEVLPRPTSDNTVFHRIRIEGIVFAGRIAAGEGPYLCVDQGVESVALGACGLASLDGNHGPIRRDARGWWICKYSASEPRIEVNALSMLGRKLLVREFGIAPIEDADDFGRRFFKAPAFNALVRWTLAHPRVSARSKRSAYMPDWYARASASARNHGSETGS